MNRIAIILMAVLIFGAACSEDNNKQPEGELIPPISAVRTSTTIEAESTPSTSAGAASSQQLLPEALWAETARLMERVESRLGSYSAEEAEAELKVLATQAIRLLRDVRRVLPSNDEFRRATLNLAQSAVNYWQQLAEATDCDRSQTCVNAREYLRASMQRLRQAWNTAATAPSTTAWGGSPFMLS